MVEEVAQQPSRDPRTPAPHRVSRQALRAFLDHRGSGCASSSTSRALSVELVETPARLRTSPGLETGAARRPRPPGPCRSSLSRPAPSCLPPGGRGGCAATVSRPRTPPAHRVSRQALRAFLDHPGSGCAPSSTSRACRSSLSRPRALRMSPGLETGAARLPRPPGVGLRVFLDHRGPVGRACRDLVRRPLTGSRDRRCAPSSTTRGPAARLPRPPRPCRSSLSRPRAPSYVTGSRDRRCAPSATTEALLVELVETRPRPPEPDGAVRRRRRRCPRGRA